MSTEALDPGFLSHVREFAGRLGKGLLRKVLIAYYIVRDPQTPIWARSTLAGALLYVGMPVDAVPDVTPFAGFTDDAAALALALTAVAASVRWRHVLAAHEAMRAWGFKITDDGSTRDPDARVNDQDL